MYKKYFKRILDLFFASIFIIGLSPLILAISFCIKIESRGPLLFKQERVGYKGKTFKIFKFRTMRIGAVQQQKIGVEVHGNDERITRIGRLLRRFKLDELAQLANIIKGDMSFIGPRPTLPEYLSLYEDWELERFDVRPGLSGLAQVNGNIFLSRIEKSQYDIQYTKNISFLLDLTILLKTFLVIIFGEEKFIHKTKQVNKE